MATASPDLDLSTLFAPRAVAVIGATGRAGSVGQAVFGNVLQHSYAGVVYPVNPRAASVMSVKAFPSVLDIPDAVDLGIIIVPRDAVPGVMAECGEKGIKAAIVITAGFKELGGDGVELEQTSLAGGPGERYPPPGAQLPGHHQHRAPGLSERLLCPADAPARQHRPGLPKRRGGGGGPGIRPGRGDRPLQVRFRGQQGRPQRKRLPRLPEGRSPDGRHPLLSGRPGRAPAFLPTGPGDHLPGPKPKPILAIKSGRTAAGARAASSHTGALAGSDEAYDALFAQCGVLRVESLEELFDYALAFAMQPLPQGNRVAIVTNAGGLGIMAVDASVRYGLEIAAFAGRHRGKVAPGVAARGQYPQPGGRPGGRPGGPLPGGPGRGASG